jgi:hypothetical protein
VRAHTFPLHLLEKLHWHSQLSSSFTYFVNFFFHAKKVQLHCAIAVISAATHGRFYWSSSQSASCVFLSVKSGYLSFAYNQKSKFEHLQQWPLCDPTKIFLTSKFSYLLFSTPTHKTKTGTANRWETTNSKALGPIIMIGQSETGSISQIIFITHFSGRC